MKTKTKKQNFNKGMKLMSFIQSTVNFADLK